MPDIFDEIAEELQWDKAAKFVQRHGKILIGSAVAVIIAVAAYSAQRNYQKSQSQKAISEYFAANQNIGKNNDQAIKQLEEIALISPHGVKEISGLKSAALLTESGKQKEAAAIYDRIAEDNRADKSFRNLAAISLAKIVIEKPDLAEKKDVVSRLSEITKSPAEPFYFSALEAKAYLEIAEGKNDDARKDFNLIANDPAAPNWIKKHANEVSKLSTYEK